MRLDQYLTEKSLVPSRSKAKDAIESGRVRVGGVICRKPAEQVADGALVELETTHPMVGRGAQKLAAAIEAFKISPAGRVCLDIGASTGGFTQILLEGGAARVYALDVGHGQLHESLREDERVINIEGQNAREISPRIITEQVSLAVIDVSFISQRLIYPALTSVLADGAQVVCLIKPQFEAGREHLSRGGIVRDERQHKRVIEELTGAAAAAGLRFKGVIDSPILGGDGNREYLAHFTFIGKTI